MLTLYPDSIFVGVFIGWVSAWFCKDLYDHPRKKEKTKRLNLMPSSSTHSKITIPISETRKFI